MWLVSRQWCGLASRHYSSDSGCSFSEFELSIPSIASKKTVAGFLLTDLASLNLDGGADKKFFGLSKEVLAAV